MRPSSIAGAIRGRSDLIPIQGCGWALGNFTRDRGCTEFVHKVRVRRMQRGIQGDGMTP